LFRKPSKTTVILYLI